MVQTSRGAFLAPGLTPASLGYAPAHVRYQQNVPQHRESCPKCNATANALICSGRIGHSISERLALAMRVASKKAFKRWQSRPAHSITIVHGSANYLSDPTKHWQFLSATLLRSEAAVRKAWRLTMDKQNKLWVWGKLLQLPTSCQGTISRFIQFLF